MLVMGVSMMVESAYPASERAAHEELALEHLLNELLLKDQKRHMMLTTLTMIDLKKATLGLEGSETTSAGGAEHTVPVPVDGPPEGLLMAHTSSTLIGVDGTREDGGSGRQSGLGLMEEKRLCMD
ncbi:hypothetical protein MHYP_G00104030 [Metynnis hypsauchen]